MNNNIIKIEHIIDKIIEVIKNILNNFFVFFVFLGVFRVVVV